MRVFGDYLYAGTGGINGFQDDLFVATANPFGPKVALRKGKEWDWEYQDNPNGGLEVWYGAHR